MKTRILALALLAAACSPPPPTPPQTVPLAPVITSFTTSPNPFKPGEKVTLSWETTNATRVTVSQLGAADLAIDPSLTTGSFAVSLDAGAVFLLTARGDGGTDTRVAAVSIDAPDSRLLFYATPAQLQVGGTATLAWSAPNAKAVTITPQGGAALDLKGQLASGSVNVTPNATTIYEIDADGRKAQATVEVAPAILALAASPQAAAAGQPVTISWKTAAASKVTLSAVGRNTLATETDLAKVADGSFADTAPALPSNGLVEYQLVAESPSGATTSQSLTVYVGVDPTLVKYTVPGFGKLGSTFDVTWKAQFADHVEVTVDGQLVYQSFVAADALGKTLTLDTPAAKAAVKITLTNVRGGVTTASKNVEPVGAIGSPAFYADKQPGISNGGELVTLHWQVPNARHVAISVQGGATLYEANGVLDTGTASVYPNKNTTYVLFADNGAGQSITPATATVVVQTPARAVFTLEPLPAGVTSSMTGTTLSGVTQVSGLPVAVKNATGAAFVDISATGTDLKLQNGLSTTATSYYKLLSFNDTFIGNIFGSPVNLGSASVSVNGWMVFATSGTLGPTDNTQNFGTALPALAIAPYWDDLTFNANSAVYWQVDGLAQQKRLIVQWSHVEAVAYPGSDLTFEAQIYWDGHIVFAYQSLSGVPGTNDPTIGVLDIDKTQPLVVPGYPAAGDTYTLFGPTTLPINMKSRVSPYNARVELPGGFLELPGTPELLTSQFFLSEVNYRPAASVTAGQWFELTNTTSRSYDLSGWVLDFGGGNTHTLTSLQLPPNSQVLLAQSAGAGDGLATDYVYGSALTLPATSGTLKLLVSGVTATTATWSSTSPGGPGISLRIGPNASDTRFSTQGGASMVCAGNQPYGTHGQLGTPKMPDNGCFPYVHQSIPGNFESILSTGTKIAYTSTDEDLKPVTLTAPVRWGTNTYSTIYVGTNGFISLQPATCSSVGGSCFYANDSSVSSAAPNGVIAPFWDDLDANSANSGVYYQLKDPDGMPGTGDEYTVVSWENYAFFVTTSSLNFQVKFFANGNIEFHYGAMSSASAGQAQGSSATSWLEDPTGFAALKVNVNSATNPGIAANSGHQFIYQP